MNWKANCEALIRACDSSIAGKPIYLLSATETNQPGPEGFAAYTGYYLDFHLAGQLDAAGLWQGGGFAAIFKLDAFREPLSLLGVALHEYAHWLTYEPAMPNERFTPGQLSEFMAAAAKFIAYARRDLPPPAEKPWADHEANFVRACCHLAYRVASICESVRPRYLNFATPYYGQKFNELTFMRSLEDELGDPRPIRSILKTQPPQRFIDLYAQATEEISADAAEANIEAGGMLV